MDVLIVVRGHPDQVASTRYRITAFLPFLEKAGATYRVVYPPQRRKVQFYLWPLFYARILFWGCLANVILVQKDIFWIPVWRWFKRAGKRIVYDFDDAIHVRSPDGGENVYYQSFRRREPEEMVAEMVKLADAVMVANENLLRFAARLTDLAEIVPMAMDLTSFAKRSRSSGRPLKIGWIGSPGTVRQLKLVEVPLREICRRHLGDEVVVQVVSRGKIPWNGVPFQQMPWTKEGEAAQIASFDIGLVPLLQDDEFAAGKSSYKLIQFMAAGLPTICSPVGFSKEVIRSGINGLVAATDQEWIDALERLIQSKELRWKMGEAARATAESEFSIDQIALRWVEIVLKRSLPEEKKVNDAARQSLPLEA